MAGFIRLVRELVDWAVSDIKQEIRKMGETLSQQIDTSTASIQASIAELAADASTIETDLAAVLPGLVPGSTVNQTQVDALAGVAAALASVTGKFDAIKTSLPAAAAPVVTDPSAPSDPSDPAAPAAS